MDISNGKDAMTKDEPRQDMRKKLPTGVVNALEAYSKKTIMQMLGISQKFWDKMLDEGLPYTNVGHTRWVTGKELIEHFTRNAERKRG